MTAPDFADCARRAGLTYRAGPGHYVCPTCGAVQLRTASAWTLCVHSPAQEAAALARLAACGWEIIEEATA